MLKVYVTEIPQKSSECPFYVNKKCQMTKDKCCLDGSTKCEHLIDLNFEFEEVTDGLNDKTV